MHISERGDHQPRPRAVCLQCHTGLGVETVRTLKEELRGLG